MDKFKQFILGVSPQLSLTSLEQLRKITVLKEYKAKDNLYEFGKIPSKFYILISIFHLLFSTHREHQSIVNF